MFKTASSKCLIFFICIFLNEESIFDGLQASMIETNCSGALKVFKTTSLGELRSNSAVASFMKQMRSLDAFTSEGERDFFLRLVKLESRLISMAIHRGIFQKGVPSSRRAQIKAIIHPLLSKRNDINFKASHPDIFKELLVWDEMRDEFIRRNLGLLVHVVTRHSSRSDWDYHLAQQLYTLNLSFEGFEPSLGFKFSSYVYLSIKKRLRDDARQLRRLSLLSSQAEILAKRLLAANHERRLAGQADLELEEIEEWLSISKSHAQQIRNLLPLLKTVELDAPVSNLDGIYKKDLIEGPDDSIKIDDEQRLKTFLELSQFLPDEKMKLILNLFRQGRTQYEMAEYFGITKQGVVHHLRRSFQYLKAILGLRSEAIKNPQDRRLIIGYFGLFGASKRSRFQLASDLKIRPGQIKTEVLRILDRVQIDDIDALIDQGASSR